MTMFDTTRATELSKDVEKEQTAIDSDPTVAGCSTGNSDDCDPTWRTMTARCLEGAKDCHGSQGFLMPRFLIHVLNSVSQVVFLTNALSGALILLAMLIGAPRGASVLGFFGALCANGISWLLGLDPDARREGLLGYNAVLVGAGFAVFVQNFLLAAVATLVFGTLSALLAAGLSRLMKPHLTLSFNVCVLSGLALIHVLELEHLLPSPAGLDSKAHEAIFQWISDFPLLDGFQFLKATLNGVPEIFVVSSPVSGVIMLVAIGLETPVGALSTLLGSLIATLGAAGCGADVLDVKTGIWGFNAALTSLWVALHFRSLGHFPVFLLVLFASCCATGVFALLAMLAELSGGWAKAPFTLPFCVVGLFLVAVERCLLRLDMCTKQKPPECTEENLATPRWHLVFGLVDQKFVAKTQLGRQCLHCRS